MVPQSTLPKLAERCKPVLLRALRSQSTTSFKQDTPEPGVSNQITGGIDFHPRVQLASENFQPFTVLGLQPHGHDFNTCDYLGIANDPRLNEVQAKAILDIGASNFNAPHAWPRDDGSAVASFQEECAEWMGYEDVILTKSCFESNMSLYPVILSDQDLPVYMDTLIHATIRLGVRAATRRDAGNPRPEVYFKHNDVEDLRRAIKEHGPGVISVESIYSQLGTVAPLKEIAAVARETGCILCCDESHSIGNVGKGGRGLVAELGLQDDVQFVTASLGKTMGCQLGIIACSASAAHHITYSSTPLMFSWAAQDERAVRAIEALRVLRLDESRAKRQFLADASQYVRNELWGAGIRGQYLMQDPISPIVSFVVGESQDVLDIVHELWDNDIYTFAMAYPAAPRDRSIVRLSCNTLVNEEGYAHLVDIFKTKILKRFDHTEWKDYQATDPLF